MGKASGESPASQEELEQYAADYEARLAVHADAPVEHDAPEEEDAPVEVEEVDFSALTVAELEAYAEEHDIDLGGASKKADIVSVIEEHGSSEESE